MKLTMLMTLAMLVASTTTTAGQQYPTVTRRTPTEAPANRNGRTTLPGPRLQPEWRSVQPALADHSASSAAVAGDSHTITVTTLVLVLAVIIAVLLIVK
jgi:hypothetical protein